MAEKRRATLRPWSPLLNLGLPLDRFRFDGVRPFAPLAYFLSDAIGWIPNRR
jgi:hypothetical protein